MALFDRLRSDRTFDNFLEVVEKEDGVAANVKSLKKLRANRRARTQAADDSYELYQDQKERGEFQGTFFQWLIENKELVIQMIFSLIKIFSL